MEFRNLKTFVRAAELHSFSQTARELGYTQSAISMQISQLEAELDTRLFDRVGRSVDLTPQGRQFFDYAQRMLQMAENARNVLHNEAVISGKLRVSMASSICSSLFPGILRRYCEKYPGVQVTVQSGTTEEMFRALAQNDVDIIYHLDDQILRSDLVVPLCRRVPIIFVAPKGHPLTQKASISLKECVRYPFILTEKGMSYRSQLDSKLAEEGLELNPFLEIGNTDVIASLVESGMGLSFLPEFVVRRQLDEGSIARLNVEGIDARLYLQLIYSRAKWMTTAMQALIDLIVEDT